MSNIDKTCGTCSHWQPGEKQKYGSLTSNTDPMCGFWKIIKYSEDKPESWCWREASTEQIKSRYKAGLI